MRNTVIIGDCLEKLKELPEASIHCCVTSPPYWGLRDYGAEGQLGLETTPDDYTARIVEVFREVRRVLRPDATLWLNIGDSYAAQGGHRSSGANSCAAGRAAHELGVWNTPHRPIAPGMKPKDLVGIPWMLAFALRADGWWLRSDVIWHKPSCMPESVTDRPTVDYEHVFLLAKSESYFYDADAIREVAATADPEDPSYRANGKSNARRKPVEVPPGQGDQHGLMTDPWREHTTRNKRCVWSINPRPYREAHFATFPPELPETCIKAGTSEKGCCPHCGAHWQRIRRVTGDDREFGRDQPIGASSARKRDGSRLTSGTCQRTINGVTPSYTPPSVETLGWQPSCSCPEHTPVPCIVLDPFAGSGTTLASAKWLGRDYIGIELNPEYTKLIEERIRPATEHLDEQDTFAAIMGMADDPTRSP